MMKSSQHHAFVKYDLNPNANHLNNISKRKITVKNLSTYPKYSMNKAFFLKLTSSKAFK